jgi:hypothetical protein
MKFYSLLLLTLFVSNALAQNETQAENKTLDDVVIKETYEAGTEEEKLPVVLKSDFTNLVEVKERINWASVPWGTGKLDPNFHLFECRVSSPEFAEIIPEPAKVIHVNFEDLARWKLDIITSDGAIFFSADGEGDPPKSIEWNGRGDSGAPLTPGEQYSYSFTATDRAGNRRTFPGEAFSVPAIYLTSENGLWVGLSYSLLFSPNGYGLLNAAEDYSTELANLVYYYANAGNIKFQSNHPDTDKFIELLAKKLGKDLNSFERVTNAQSPKDCFLMWLN